MVGPSDLSERVQTQGMEQENLQRKSLRPYRYFVIFNHY